MATHVLIHGAGDSVFYWHLLEPELRERGHDVVAMDLPCDDESAGLSEYADTVVEAIGDGRDLIVVAQSFGGFIAPLVCTRVPVELMVLVAGMIPLPGEKGDDWPAHTGFDDAARSSGVDYGDELAVFYKTSRASWPRRRCATHAGRPTDPAGNRGRWTPGRTSGPDTCSASTTASSPPSGCAG
jgi:pimeloyl-ACP methyl ester carboxylesterase